MYILSSKQWPESTVKYQDLNAALAGGESIHQVTVWCESCDGGTLYGYTDQEDADADGDAGTETRAACRIVEVLGE